MSKVIRTGGGTFDPTEQNVYFIAANTERLEHGIQANNYVLVAVNELAGQDSMRFFVTCVHDPQKRVFLDSGVYNLATTYARKHGVSMDVGLSTNPSDMEDFEPLFEQYVDIVRTYGDRLWCYIEIDQGGRENKIKTRTRLEKLGLRPTPVYHPLNDGWDYFDYLAERYDRICFGNIVHANSVTRKKLIATAWERHRKYPHLWIHLLGLTPNQWLNAFPINSGDSSSWLHAIRWTEFPAYCSGHAFGVLERGFRYILGSDPSSLSGSIQATKFSAYRAHMDMLTWRGYLGDLSALGIEVYPPPHKEVKRANRAVD
jgi:hypothetical protein